MWRGVLVLLHFPFLNAMNLHLQNKLALVTGSTKGIGHAIAVALAAEGARVIVNGRTEASVGDAIARLRTEVPDAQVEGFAGDLSNPAQVDALLGRFPKVDILINNLGIFEPKPFEEIDDAEWQHFFNVNVLSGARLSRAYLPGMRAQNWGRIVFISSESGVQIPVEMIHYGVTKTALLGLSRGLAELTAGTAITVNAVLPGPTRSEVWSCGRAVRPIPRTRRVRIWTSLASACPYRRRCRSSNAARTAAISIAPPPTVTASACS